MGPVLQNEGFCGELFHRMNVNRKWQFTVCTAGPTLYRRAHMVKKQSYIGMCFMAEARNQWAAFEKGK